MRFVSQPIPLPKQLHLPCGRYKKAGRQASGPLSFSECISHLQQILVRAHLTIGIGTAIAQIRARHAVLTHLVKIEVGIQNALNLFG